MAFLNGKKTYIVAGVMAFAAFAYSVGWITKEQLEMVEAFLVAAGLTTIRQAIGGKP